MEEILLQAERSEKDYDWLGAAESYEKALELLPEDDFSRKAETYERLGYAFYRAAFQAESKDAFRQKLNQAITAYEKANEHYQKLNDPAKTGRALRCDAMNAYMGYWFWTGASEKKKLLNDCWRLAKGALEAFEVATASLDYGKTFNQLSASPILEFTLESDFQARLRIMREAVERGEKAIRFLYNCSDASERARAYAKTALCLGVFGLYCQDLREREPTYQRGQQYWHKAKELSEEIAVIESLYPVFGGQPIFGLEGSEEALENYRKGLECAKKTKDRFFIGCALDWLAYHNVWVGGRIEFKDELAKRAQYQTVTQYSEDARDQFAKILFISPRADAGWIEASSLNSDFYLAGIETDVKKKCDLLEKARKAAPDMLKKAEDSGYPEAMNYAHMMISGIFGTLAGMETDQEEKKRLLEQVLHHEKEFAEKTEQIVPLHYFNRGYAQGTLGWTKAEIAQVAEDDDTKRSLLQEAIRDMDNGLKLLTEEVTFFEGKQSGSTYTGRWALGSFQSNYGNVLNRLYNLTRNREYLEKCIEAFREATESFRRFNLKSRMAECHWKIAQAYDELDDHMTAASNFCLASDNFKGAAEKIPQLKNFYEDHAVYMQAWGEIEKARHHHERQEYGLAKEHFEKAAELHELLKRWSYLEPNYSAWARVEDAEELSRNEKCEESLHGFEQATRLFQETKKSMQENLAKIEDAEEKKMATQIFEATDPRCEYCKARMAIEEAKILDKKGDHGASSEKYCSAGEILQRTTRTAESVQEKKELTLIITLSQAWAKMTRAEAEGSPDLYAEASKLFEEAKEFSPNERAKMLALGHSRFCRALEAGTKFADTRDATMHTAAIHHLESAATYYVKADFPMASEYAKATELLFDAYAQMDKAKEEEDPEKKTRLYILAEKVLQTSAGAYMKAEHPEKSAQVQRLLEKVREEREFATSLMDVLHAPSVVSTTAAFTTPTPTEEEAVGLERLEHANVQANLIIRQKELKIGENLSMELELVNAGKGSALLTKITEIVPKGFDVAEKPEMYRVEDSYINLKGKRLDPLKTEEVKVVLKPTLQGTFSIKPTVLYLDENGKNKTHELEPVTITVKELGIKGWLKGER